MLNSHMKRALGAIIPWGTFAKGTAGDSALEDSSQAAANAVRAGAAFRRMSLLQARPSPGQLKKDSSERSNSTVLDAHLGPHPSSDHASG